MKFYIRTANQNSYSPSTKSPSTSCQKPVHFPKNPLSHPQKSPSKSLPKPPPKKKKINLIALKKDTINSLNEVEHFLCNFQNIYKYIKLYKILH